VLTHLLMISAGGSFCLPPMESFSRAVAIPAAALLLTTRVSTSRRMKFLGVKCGGQIRPHICWFGEVPFNLDRIYQALDDCTLFMAVGTSGMVEPAATLPLLSMVGRGRFTCARRTPRIREAAATLRETDCALRCSGFTRHG